MTVSVTVTELVHFLLTGKLSLVSRNGHVTEGELVGEGFGFGLTCPFRSGKDSKQSFDLAGHRSIAAGFLVEVLPEKRLRRIHKVLPDTTKLIHSAVSGVADLSSVVISIRPENRPSLRPKRSGFMSHSLKRMLDQTVDVVDVRLEVMTIGFSVRASRAVRRVEVI